MYWTYLTFYIKVWSHLDFVSISIRKNANKISFRSNDRDEKIKNI